MKKKPIDPKDASVAATFYQPSYQRLRQWYGGRSVNLLCFVDETSERVRQILENIGASPSRTFRANCFLEIWEVPDDQRLIELYEGETARLDQQIAEALGCQAGRFTAACGNLMWGDAKQGPHRRHFESQLLKEATRKTGRAK